MSSIIEGYKYDIFISYRQKDNKGDRWVSEFVETLKTELESTFKEEISVYFDINPHDGLLETHDVDESLKDKLKCLVFIPIISRTYCDPKSFAWEHEFKTFVDLASEDQFGLKVKLPNGNVANRVLPIKIHDLDPDDIKQCESVLDGVLRGVEFIYKEPGFNRPLKPDDDEKINLNKTKYRNQTTKVALAIKEIILGLQTEPVSSVKERIRTGEQIAAAKVEIQMAKGKPINLNMRNVILGFAILTFLIIAAILANPKFFRHDKLEDLRSSDGRITVAVMPFQNMTNDSVWNVWQYIIQDNLINYFSNYTKELKTIQAELINNYIRTRGIKDKGFITNRTTRIISANLNAGVMIKGSMTQARDVIILNSRIIDSRRTEALKTFEVRGRSSEQVILQIIDSLRIKIRNYLIISIIEKEGPADFPMKYFEYTKSTDAYKYFIYGQNSFWNKDYSTAKDWFLKAVQIDSSFFNANVMLSYAYEFTGSMQMAKQLVSKLFLKRDQMTIAHQIVMDHLHAHYFGTLQDRIKYAKQYEILDDQTPINYYTIASNYNALGQYDLAIPEFEKALVLYEKYGYDPSAIWSYIELGYAFHRTGQLNKEERLYKKAEKEFPDNPDLLYRKAILSLTEGDTRNADKYIDKFVLIGKEKLWSEIDLTTFLAEIYSEADMLERAEQCYRKALQSIELISDNLSYFNNLAWFLIDKNRNIEEGMIIVDKALKLDQDDYALLNTKGWGLYKQGKNKEALEILQKSWDLRMKEAIYDHSAYLASLRLEKVKKAVAGQKN